MKVQHFLLKIVDAVKEAHHSSICEALEEMKVQDFPLKIAKVAENVVSKEVKTLHSLIATAQEKALWEIEKVEKKTIKNVLLHYWCAFFGTMKSCVLKMLEIFLDQSFLTLLQYQSI